MDAEQIDALDIAIFEAITSQTTAGDRRSLLAVHRATAQKHKAFSYLEIGSHLGGSIQPYLLDDRCTKVYSIDSRPSQQPDDRSPGFVAYYDGNSSARMIDLLTGIGKGAIGKIECIDADASEIDPSRIREAPEILLIDGEHTRTAVLSDFRFCEKVASRSGTIVFHDFPIIYPAIVEICRQLDRQRRSHVPLKLEDNVFAIFFDADLIGRDPYLEEQHRQQRHFLRDLIREQRLKRLLPGFAFRATQAVRAWFGKRAG